MAIRPTIIPQKIDLSKSVDLFTIDYKAVLGSDNPDNKLQLAKEFLKDIAEHNLRITSLEVNAGISGADDELSDIFEVKEGIKNSVDLDKTTTQYNVGNKTYANNLNWVSKGIRYTTIAHSSDSFYYSVDDNYYYQIQTDTHRLRLSSVPCVLNVKSTVTTPIIYDIKNSNGDLIFSTTINYTSGTTGYKVYNRSITQILPENDTYYIYIKSTNTSHVDVVYGQNTHTYTIYDTITLKTKPNKGFDLTFQSYPYNLEETSPQEKEIWVRYTLDVKPSACYLALYSGAFQEDEIGDVYFYFTDGTHNSILMRPWSIYNGLSLSFTPTHVVIVQKNTQVSKVSKYVLLIAY